MWQSHGSGAKHRTGPSRTPRWVISEVMLMFIVLILLVALCAIGAVVALVRGLIAFSHTSDVLRQGDEPYLQHGARQNQLMTQRLMYQGMAILTVVILGMLFSPR
jgi:hypothetical protein